jgi:hypothetical protein
MKWCGFHAAGASLLTGARLPYIHQNLSPRRKSLANLPLKRQAGSGCHDAQAAHGMPACGRAAGERYPSAPFALGKAQPCLECLRTAFFVPVSILFFPCVRGTANEHWRGGRGTGLVPIRGEARPGCPLTIRGSGERAGWVRAAGVGVSWRPLWCDGAAAVRPGRLARRARKAVLLYKPRPDFSARFFLHCSAAAA